MQRHFLKRALLLIFLLSLFFFGSFYLSAPAGFHLWEIPKSNRTTSSYPVLSYKIFLTVLALWVEPIPRPQPTLLRIPVGSALNAAEKTVLA